jgi:hypothetical protein
MSTSLRTAISRSLRLAAALVAVFAFSATSEATEAHAVPFTESQKTRCPIVTGRIRFANSPQPHVAHQASKTRQAMRLH